MATIIIHKKQLQRATRIFIAIIKERKENSELVLLYCCIMYGEVYSAPYYLFHFVTWPILHFFCSFIISPQATMPFCSDMIVIQYRSYTVIWSILHKCNFFHYWEYWYWLNIELYYSTIAKKIILYIKKWKVISPLLWNCFR